MFRHLEDIYGSRLPPARWLTWVCCESVLRRGQVTGGEVDPWWDVLATFLLQHACCPTEPLEGGCGREVEHTGSDTHEAFMSEHAEREET